MKFKILYFYYLLHLTAPCLSSSENAPSLDSKNRYFGSDSQLSPTSITARYSENDLQQIKASKETITTSNRIPMSLRNYWQSHEGFGGIFKQISTDPRSSEKDLQQKKVSRFKIVRNPMTASSTVLMNLKNWQSRPDFDKELEQLFSKKEEA